MIGIRDAESGLWLKSYDPDFRPDQPQEGEEWWRTGLAEWTIEPGEAMNFADQKAAWECWMSQSRTLPLRQDGEPNRPLTAVTIIVEAIPDE